MVKEIDFEEFKNLIMEGDTELIDVREDFEFAQSHFKTSKNIPMSLVPLKLAEIDFSKKVIFVCRSGGRSAMIANMVAKETGKDVYNLAGGIIAAGDSALIEK